MIDIKAYSLGGTSAARGTYAITASTTAPAVVQVPAPSQYAVSRINYRIFNGSSTAMSIQVTYDGSQPNGVFPVSGAPQAGLVMGPFATEVFEGCLNGWFTAVAPVGSTPTGAVYVNSEQGT